MRLTPGYMECTHGGYRYWGTLCAAVDGRFIWRFWSSRQFPFYHGHYTQRVLDREEAMRKFLEWVPFGGGA